MTLSKNIQANDDTTYDHVIKYTGLFGGVQGLTILMNIVRNMITAKLLGPAGIGFINLFNKTTGLINQATNFGISMSAVKHVAKLYDMGDEPALRSFIHTVRSWTTLTALIGAFIGFVLSPLLSQWEFKDYSQLCSFLQLAPVIGIMSLNAGEMAILKGVKQLKKVALISVFTAAATLLASLPLYVFWGIGSIATALLLSNVAALVIHLYYSTKVVPWSCSPFSVIALRQGTSMITLGIAFILAGVFGEAAALFIQTCIKDYGGLEAIGFYNCGYTLAITSTTIVFVAMDADFFPRLSAAEHDLKRQNRNINQQIEVCLILTVPCLIFFLIALPLIIPVLYSEEFMPVMPMVVYASIFMVIKAFDLPISYLPLAKGDSRTYMFVEFVFDLLIALLIPYSYHHWGLPGTGIALSLCGLFNLTLIYFLYRRKYHYRMQLRKGLILIAQIVLYAFTFYVALHVQSSLRYVLGVPLLATSLFLSLRIIKQETHFIQRLQNKLRRK